MMRSDPSKDAVAARLKEARERIFGSAADAARALGMKPVTVRAHESGQNSISYYDLEKYARRYGVSLLWLMSGEGDQDAQATTEMHHSYGVPLFVHSLVEDGVWLPSEDSADFLPTRVPPAPDGDPEFAIYADPRFPAEMVSAFKVVSHKPGGEYLNGSIIFVIPVEAIGYRRGDHVLVVSQRKTFYEWSLRRVDVDDQGEDQWTALTSDAPPLTLTDSDDETVNIVGVVFGAEVRRPVPALDLRERQEFELVLALEQGRRMRLPGRMSPDDEHAVLLEAVRRRVPRVI